MAIKLRLLVESDLPELERVHARQVRSCGVFYPFPGKQLLEDPDYEVVVVGTDKHDRPRGAMVIHRTYEVYTVTDDPAILRSIANQMPKIEEILRRRGISELHAFVPYTMRERMAWFLRRIGFRDSNPLFKPYYREVGPAAEASAEEQIMEVASGKR